MEQSQTRSPNIRDVSKHAGVSATTVSRVLNNSAIPSMETRQRVLAAVDKLGYRVDALFSQAVKRDRQGLRGTPAMSGTIGYLANLRYLTGANRSDGYYSAVASGIESVVRKNHNHLMLEGLEWGQRTIPECVAAERVDGILVEGTIDDSLRSLLASRLPYRVPRSHVSGAELQLRVSKLAAIDRAPAGISMGAGPSRHRDFLARGSGLSADRVAAGLS